IASRDNGAIDINGASWTTASLQTLLYDLILSNPSASTVNTLFTQDLKGSTQGLSLQQGPALAQETFGQLLTILLQSQRTTLDAAAASVGQSLSNAFQNYAVNTGVGSVVSGVTYNQQGLMTEETAAQTWKSIGGGNIPGVDSGWTNGSATVVTEYEYGTG